MFLDEAPQTSCARLFQDSQWTHSRPGKAPQLHRLISLPGSPCQIPEHLLDLLAQHFVLHFSGRSRDQSFSVQLARDGPQDP